MKNFHTLMLFLLSNLLYSCIEDEVKIIVPQELEQNAVMLRSLEATGDFINSRELPGTIDAEEVFLNLDNYLVLDIRGKKHYDSGHIPGSLLSAHSELENIIEENKNKYSKIVIASYTGQSACFYTTLLRYLGYNNVYSLKFGMASWHLKFASYWLEVINNNISMDLDYTHPWEDPKPGFTNLPAINFENSDISTGVKNRIRGLLNETFIDTLQPSYDSPVVTSMHRIQDNTMEICYSLASSYYSKINVVRHPPDAIQYVSFPKYELRSREYLQTLPPGIPIHVYSSNGFESACATAYLRILGYNAKSELFGTSHIAYNNIINVTDAEQYIFSFMSIKNYSFSVN